MSSRKHPAPQEAPDEEVTEAARKPRSTYIMSLPQNTTPPSRARDTLSGGQRHAHFCDRARDHPHPSVLLLDEAHPRSTRPRKPRSTARAEGGGRVAP